MNDRQLVLDTVEEICADTNNIDEVCMALEHSTIFATEMIQNLVEVIDKYKNVIDKALYWLSENTHYTSLKVDKLVLDENANLKELLELLEEVE